jgi:hypothetical protein
LIGTTITPSFTQASQRSITAMRFTRQNASRSPRTRPRERSSVASRRFAALEVTERERGRVGLPGTRPDAGAWGRPRRE